MKGRYSSSVVLILALIVWWSLAAILKVSYLPTPSEVLIALIDSLKVDLVIHFAASLFRVLAGLLLALILGVPAGLAIGRSRKVDRASSGLIYATFPIPKIVFLPVLILALGLGDLPKVVLLLLTLFFQILVTTRDGARDLPESALRSIKALGANRWQTFRHVIWPYCAPSIFTALRIGTGTAIAVLFFAESFATDRGLGYFIMNAWGRADYPSMYAGITAMSVLGLGLYSIIDAVQRGVCPWLESR